MSECRMCRARGKTWSGSDPTCAFRTEGAFADNWNCATVNAIRDLFPRWDDHLAKGCHKEYCDDQWFGTINVYEVDFPEDSYYCLWLSWYKQRGRTEAMWLLSPYSPPREPTEADLLAIIAHYTALAAADASNAV